MKYMFYIMSFFVLNDALVLASEAQEVFIHKDYSQEDLALVRIAWARQENRLGNLKYEASEISTSHVVDYFNGSTYVASINANDNTITTRLSEDKSVTLSYEDFSKLLRDKTILDLANKRLKDQQGVNKTSSKFKAYFASWFKK